MYIPYRICMVKLFKCNIGLFMNRLCVSARLKLCSLEYRIFWKLILCFNQIKKTEFFITRYTSFVYCVVDYNTSDIIWIHICTCHAENKKWNSATQLGTIGGVYHGIRMEKWYYIQLFIWKKPNYDKFDFLSIFEIQTGLSLC